MNKRPQRTGKLTARAHEEMFRADVLATVRAKHPVTETDLVESLRGSFWATFGSDKPAGVQHYWRIGTYDFRSIIGDMVSQGVLHEDRGRQRGGGIETTYSIGQEAQHAEA